MRYISLLLIAIVVLGILSFSSYYISKKSADELVGGSIDYFQLTNTNIEIKPLGRNQIAWVFNYSHPGSFDEEFYVYTTLLGRVSFTNPRDLESRLRGLEKLKDYPYSKIEVKKNK